MRPHIPPLRLGIRLQLISLIVGVAAISLVIMAGIVGGKNANYVLSLESSQLLTVTELKASQIQQSFSYTYYSVYWMTSRATIQDALESYKAGNYSESNWAAVDQFFNTTLTSSSYSNLLAIGMYDYNQKLVYNITNSTVGTYSSFNAGLQPLKTNTSGLNSRLLGAHNGIVSGPLASGNYSDGTKRYLLSITVPVMANTTILIDTPSIAGYMTFIMSAYAFKSIIDDDTGISPAGSMFLLAGANVSATDIDYYYNYQTLLVPTYRSSLQSLIGGIQSFATFPSIAPILQHSESGRGVKLNSIVPVEGHMSVAYSSVDIIFGTWAVAVTEPISYTHRNTSYLRNVIIGTVFGVLGFVLIASCIMAYFAVKPIYLLHKVILQTKMDFSHNDSYQDDGKVKGIKQVTSNYSSEKKTSQNSINDEIVDAEARGASNDTGGQNERPTSGVMVYREPARVPVFKRLFRDELSDLAEAYNHMSEQQVKQYTELEDQVRERTRELELEKVKAERANEAKSRFIANITHELRTPLNGILGMTAVAMTEKDVRKVHRSFRVIYKSGELLLKLLTDLLTFSKNQIGTVSLDQKEFFIGEIEEKVRSLHEKALRDKNLSLTCVVEPLYVRNMPLVGDPTRILQIITNLMCNAIKFTPENGHVVFAVRCLGEEMKRNDKFNSTALQKIRSRDDKQHVTDKPPIDPWWVEFEVKDTGPGVPRDLQDRIFEPFFQGDQALSRKHGGTGLGLSICKQLAEMMGGSITLMSDSGRGSRFVVSLPLYSAIDYNALKRLSGSVNSVVHVTSSHLQHELSRMNSNVHSNFKQPTGEQITKDDHSQRNSFPAADVESSDTTSISPAVANSKNQASIATDGTNSNTTSVARKNSDGGYFAFKKKSTSSKNTRNISYGKGKVLIAEDNYVNQEVIKRMLRLEGIDKIVLCNNGREAITHIEDAIKDGTNFDLVFMDVHMPVVNGIDATKILRGSLGYPYPIIGLTADTNDEKVQACIQSGMNSVLSKPIIRKELHDALVRFCPELMLHEPTRSPQMTPDVD